MSLGSSHPSLDSGFSAASLDKDGEQIADVAKTVVASISQVISWAGGATVEKSNFAALGSYLYRTSPIIMELQTTTTAPPGLVDLLLCLSSNVNLTGDLVGKCLAGGGAMRDGELRIIVKQLEGVVQNMGRCLGSIPSSAFKNRRYAEIAALSLSRDMTSAHFVTGEGMGFAPARASEDEEEEEVPPPAPCSDVSSASESESPRPRLVDFIAAMHYSSRERSASSGESSPTPVAEYIEPLYESFFCPLTKKIMEDPVTIETGVTCEREAILEWFQSCDPAGGAAVCPVTRRTLGTRAVSSNLALKTTIEEWKKRNEEIRVKVARSTLSKATSENVVLEALADLQLLCRSRRNKVKMCNVGLVPLLARLLEHKSRKLRCEAMETLRLLIQEHEEGKELAARTNAIGTAVKILSSRHLSEKLASVSFLLELSKSEKLCARVGAVTGGIPMLITLKHNPSSEAAIVEKAGEALKNLEKCPKNVGIMAENGLLDPLLENLIDGPEDLRMEMGSILVELVLGDDAMTRVAERASGALIRMVRSGNTLARKAALKTLLQLSSHRPSSQILINADLLPAMAEELFIRKIDDEPMDSRADSAAILANLLESGVDPEKKELDAQGHTMASDYFIRNTCRMIKISMPSGLNESLVRILSSLMEWKRAAQGTVKAVKAADTSYILIEFLSCLEDKLCAAAMELLIKLSPFMGHTIAERLCKSRGQPEGLIDELRADQITRRQELAATLLVKLPHRNLELNLSLLRHGGAAVALQEIQRIQRGETRATRHRRGFFEGLVGTLVRFTATLHEDEVLLMARELNLAALFTELVAGAAGSEEVQRLSAVGLEKLSAKSAELSAPPPPQVQPRKPRMGKLLPRILSPSEKTQQQQRLCPVHRGLCSPSSTFCLVEAGAVEALLGCMEHGGAAVAEAALAALCTLLDDAVDVAGGAAVLAELGAVKQVLGALRARRDEEGLRRRCFWVLERFLMNGGEAARRDIAGDRALPSILMSAVHGGDASMKQAAEIILRRLNKIPDVSISLVY